MKEKLKCHAGDHTQGMAEQGCDLNGQTLNLMLFPLGLP